MQKYAIDTSSLISFVTDRNFEQKEIMSRYFVAAANLEHEIVILSNVITEFVYVLNRIYKLSAHEVKVMLEAILETPGIAIEVAYGLETILSLWPAEMKDYGDAVVASFAIKQKIRVVTFDRNLRKFLRKHHLSAI